jgi:hypothetical protein
MTFALEVVEKSVAHLRSGPFVVALGGRHKGRGSVKISLYEGRWEKKPR